MPSKRLTFALLIFGWLSECWALHAGIRVCFKETERSSQCQEGPSHTCSGWSFSPAWSEAFRDDTDNRGGGCKYHWRIERQDDISNVAKEYRLCFQETEGSSQCQGTRSSCTGWSSRPSWTSPFRDDTDNRGGGCKYQWKIEERIASTSQFQVCRVCFKETEGSSQCQLNRETCSGWSAAENPDWTLTYRDDTDNRGGGCHYSWYLDCTAVCQTTRCPRDRPCEQ